MFLHGRDFARVWRKPIAGVKIDKLFNFVDDMGLAEIIDTQMEIFNI